MPELTLERAKDVIEKAIEHEAFSWDDPSSVTDEKTVASATNLLGLCEQASKGGSVADAVLEILHAAGVEPLSDVTREAYTRKFGADALTNGHAPVESAEPAPEPDDSPVRSVSEQASDPASAPDLSEIFPGYDDFKVADIKKAILESAASGELTSEEWELIKAYERVNEERKTILSLEPEFKAPEPEPTPQPTAPSATGAFTQTMTVTPAPDGSAQTVEFTQPSETSEGGETSRAQQEGLPLPQQIDFAQSPPVLPINITSTGDAELSQIATQFHSCYARAHWAQSQEEGRRDHAEHLEREAERDAYIQAYELHRNEIPEEKRTQPTAIEAARKAAERDAETNGQVRKYRSAKVRHGIDARELKALAAGYDKAVWRINEELERRARLQTTRPA
jgi:hypothetical protein